MIAIIILALLPSLLVLIDFIGYNVTGKRLYNIVYSRALEIISILIIPLLYLIGDNQDTNDCCTESATFSPEHILIINVVISICIITYFLSAYKKTIISPIVETLINSILLGGIVFNVFMAIHVQFPYWIVGNLPVILLFVLELSKNQRMISGYSSNFDLSTMNYAEKIAWKILNFRPIFKIPVLLIICLPILVLISSFMLLFGQKPDSIIRAFTDTYKHGFSQLDYMCENVDCGGHFLCSVAAKGHKRIVKPIRLGERGGNRIMCNRQLLIANAFEELIEDNFPKLHKYIRRNYNKVGNVIHRYYLVFNIKIIADMVYIMMKPLEWFFLLVLYTFDRNPENRIAKQYLSPIDRDDINQKFTTF